MAASVNEPARVGVVIATHNRPALMRTALASVLEQDYAGDVEVVVVFDRSEPEHDLETDDPHRRVRVTTNARTAGLAGARNTGILALDTQFVAFCDDDDVWLPGKLAAQVERLGAEPDANFVTTAMRVDYRDRQTVRLAGRDQVTMTDLVRSRMAMLHSSSYLFRRAAMVDAGGFGLVDEDIPRSMAEDWDILLRAARQAPIAHVDEPLVAVLWGQSSYFNDSWTDKVAAHQWLLDHHPELRADPKGHALILGKLAFGNAATGHRRVAVRRAWQAFRANWREPRVAVVVLVLLGVPPRWVITQLNKRGHGI